MVFIVNFLCRDGWLTLQVTAGVFFLGWLAASGALASVLKWPHKLSLFSILLILWVSLVSNFSYPYEWGVSIQYPLFLTLYHSGTAMLCLFCLTLLLAQVSGGWRPVFFGLLLTLIFLAGVSDALFFVVFAIPAFATLVLLALAFPRHWKNYLVLGLSIAAVSMAAYFLASYCFPPKLATGNYTHVGFDNARGTFLCVLSQLYQPQHHFYIFLIVLDVLTVIVGGIGSLLFCFPSMRKQFSPMGLTLLVFCSSAVFLNWAAVLFTGDYSGMDENRYLQVALILPLFLIAFGLHHIILWQPWRENLLAIGATLFTITVAFIPQAPSDTYADAMSTIPALKNIMREYHIKTGLTDYWSANLITLLSHDSVPLRAATGDGNVMSWVNSLEWYGKGHPAKDWPKFRLIYMPDPRFKDSFGAPDQIVYTPGKEEVWIYSEARAIQYNPYFGVLSNSLRDNGTTMVINASTLPGGGYRKSSEIFPYRGGRRGLRRIIELRPLRHSCARPLSSSHPLSILKTSGEGPDLLLRSLGPYGDGRGRRR